MRNHPIFRHLRPLGIAVVAVLVSLAATPSEPSVPEGDTGAPNPVQVATDAALLQWLTGPIASHQSWFSQKASVTPASAHSFTIFPRPDQRRQLLSRLPYGEAIHVAADRHNLDGFLLAAIVEAESGFNSRVVSPAGAVGLMQVMPDLAQERGTDPFDPRGNLDLGASYFSDLMREFNGDVALALAAYNAGPATVERYGKVPPYRETTRFVQRVLALYESHNRQAELVATKGEFTLAAR